MIARSPLDDLPNVGAALARNLEAAGIHDAAELRRGGAVQAALRMPWESADEAPCRSRLCAMEGAIRGVRWHAIPKDEREALWLEYRARLRG